MNLLTKLNGLGALLCCVFMIILLNVLLTYWDRSDDVSTFSKLRVRKVHKYAGVHNHTVSSIAPLIVQIHSSGRTSQASNYSTSASIAHNNINNNNNNNNISSSTKIGINDSLAGTQDLNYFTSPHYNVRNTTGSGQKSALPICELPTDGGPIKPNVTLESLDVVEAQLGPLLKPGGAFEPPDCIPKHHVAIVVPFRDRYAHLSVFLRNIHPFLMQQHIAYRIFIVEQTNGKPFNRAALMNIGFLEALKIYPWDCFIFHDVDLLPLDSRNLYSCPRQPRHMSVAIDVLNYKLPYVGIFGGVSALTRKHFETVNGFSNSFFGWGAEDDDMYNRLKSSNLFIARYPINIARYTMLKHPKEKANPKRFENLMNGIEKMETDGINSIKYDLYSMKEFPTFTWYLAELKIAEQKS